MRQKIKSLFLTKTNVFSATILLFSYLLKLKEFIISFASNLLLVALSVSFLIVGMIIHFFFHKKLKTDSSPVGDNDTVSASVKDRNESVSVFPKILFSIAFFILIMTMGSLYYIKNMGVYYVVLRKNLSQELAKKYVNQINLSEEFVLNNLSTRYIEIGKTEKYELILYNGYVSLEKARKDLNKVKAMNTGFLPYLVGPQSAPSFRKKIKYLQNHVIHQFSP